MGETAGWNIQEKDGCEGWTWLSEASADLFTPNERLPWHGWSYYDKNEGRTKVDILISHKHLNINVADKYLGGKDSSSYIDDILEVDPLTGQWKLVDRMNHAMYHAMSLGSVSVWNWWNKRKTEKYSLFYLRIEGWLSQSTIISKNLNQFSFLGQQVERCFLVLVLFCMKHPTYVWKKVGGGQNLITK